MKENTTQMNAGSNFSLIPASGFHFGEILFLDNGSDGAEGLPYRPSFIALTVNQRPFVLFFE